MPARKSTRTQTPGNWVKIHTGLPRHPKITSAGKPGALALALVAICLAAEAKTDGEFDLDFAIREACTDEVTAKALIANDFFHEFGHECRKCPQPRHRGLHVVHDYLEWQRPAAVAATLSEKRREYGARGGRKRSDNIAARKAAEAAASAAAPVPVPAAEPVAEPVLAPAAKAPARKRKAAAKIAQPSLLDHASGSTSYPATLTSPEADTKTAPPATEAEMDVELHVTKFCDYLATKIEQRTGRRPKITESGWLTPARLLLTKDNGGKGWKPEDLRAVVDWCTDLSTGDGQFWSTVILSIKALRNKTKDADVPRIEVLWDRMQVRNRARRISVGHSMPSAGHRNLSPEDRRREDEEFLATFGRYTPSPTTTLQEELWPAA